MAFVRFLNLYGKVKVNVKVLSLKVEDLSFYDTKTIYKKSNFFWPIKTKNFCAVEKKISVLKFYHTTKKIFLLKISIQTILFLSNKKKISWLTLFLKIIKCKMFFFLFFCSNNVWFFVKKIKKISTVINITNFWTKRSTFKTKGVPAIEKIDDSF